MGEIHTERLTRLHESHAHELPGYTGLQRIPTMEIQSIDRTIHAGIVAEFLRQLSTRTDTIYLTLSTARPEHLETICSAARDMCASLTRDLLRAAETAKEGTLPPCFDGRLWEGSQIIPPVED